MVAADHFAVWSQVAILFPADQKFTTVKLDHLTGMRSTNHPETCCKHFFIQSKDPHAKAKTATTVPTTGPSGPLEQSIQPFMQSRWQIPKRVNTSFRYPHPGLTTPGARPRFRAKLTRTRKFRQPVHLSLATTRTCEIDEFSKKLAPLRQTFPTAIARPFGLRSNFQQRPPYAGDLTTSTSPHLVCDCNRQFRTNCNSWHRFFV